MKLQNLFALSLGLTIAIAIAPSISIAQPTAKTITTNGDRLTAPKIVQEKVTNRSLDDIVQDETNWLKRQPSNERQEKLLQFEGEILGAATLSDRLSGGGTIPSKASVSYFKELRQKYPQSGAIASFYGRSLADGAADLAQIEKIFDPLIAQHPTHPSLLASYSGELLQKSDNSLPAPLQAKLTALYDRAIAQAPQNTFLYVGRAGITPKAPATILQQWKTTVAKFPNDPTIAFSFARLILENQDPEAKDYPQVLAIVIPQIEATIQQNPKNGQLYELYSFLHSKTKTPQKALPVLQAGFAKGAEAARLNYLIGDAYLSSGEADSAIAHYQKVVQAKTALCWGNMTQRFEGLKTPEQQKAMLNLILQSLSLKGGEKCTTSLAAIGFNPDMSQRFGKEMIAAIKPIAQSGKNVELRRVLLGLMLRQKQYAEITQIGPKLLPSNGTELTLGEYLEAVSMPGHIAEAHENLGNLDQAVKFYKLLSEYIQASDAIGSPESANYIMNWHLGRINWKSGKSAEAIKLLQTVTANQDYATLQFQAIDGDYIAYHALAHNLLGEIFQSQGKTAEAKQAFEAAIKADADFNTPKENLAKLK